MKLEEIMTNLDFNFDAHPSFMKGVDDKERISYLLEAIFKSNINCGKLLFDSVNKDGSGQAKSWGIFSDQISDFDENKLLALLNKIVAEDDCARRVVCVEVNFDCFQDQYQNLLNSMQEADWQYLKPQSVLDEIIAFGNEFQVPRVKLRLLLEFAGWADTFDSSDEQLIFDALAEVEDILPCMPTGFLSQINGGWFYQRGINELRQFCKN